MRWLHTATLDFRDPKTVLLAVLTVLTVAYSSYWVHRLRLDESRRNGWSLGLIGAGTNFFDTLGIGSFAPTTALFRLLKLVPDRVIPGTLNVGHTLPTVAQAFIFVAAIQVGPWTLILMIAAAVAGAWLGAGIVAGLPRRQVQIGMGVALLVAAGFIFRQLLENMKKDASAVADAAAAAGTIHLEGSLLLAGLVGNFVLGALMTLGIGLYAPCMVLVTMLGMNVTTAFPIMMGSCAFLMPVASVKFVQADSYSPRAALGLALGGIPAVMFAGLIIKSLEVEQVRWLVFAVVLYTAVLMLRSALSRKAAVEAEGAS